MLHNILSPHPEKKTKMPPQVTLKGHSDGIHHTVIIPKTPHKHHNGKTQKRRIITYKSKQE